MSGTEEIYKKCLFFYRIILGLREKLLTISEAFEMLIGHCEVTAEGGAVSSPKDTLVLGDLWWISSSSGFILKMFPNPKPKTVTANQLFLSQAASSQPSCGMRARGLVAIKNHWDLSLEFILGLFINEVIFISVHWFIGPIDHHVRFVT